MIMPQSHRIHKHLSHGPHLPNTRVPITTSTTKRPRSFQLVRTFNKSSSPTQVWSLFFVDKTFVNFFLYLYGMSNRFESNTAPREFENPHNPCYSEHLDYEHLRLRFSGTPIDKTLQNKVAHDNMFCYNEM